jgi:hypothetical protein
MSAEPQERKLLQVPALIRHGIPNVSDLPRMTFTGDGGATARSTFEREEY